MESNRIRRRERYHAKKGDRGRLDIHSDGVAEEIDDKSECSSRYDVLASKASKESDLNGQLTGFLPVVASVVRPRPVPTSAPDTPQDPYFKNSTTLFHLMHHQQPPAGDHQGTVKKALSEQEALVVLSSIENILHLIKDLFEAIVPQLPQRLQPSVARTLDAFKSLGPAMQLVTSLTAATHTASDGQPHAAFNGNAELSRYTLETSQMGVMPVCGGERTEVPKNIYMQPTSVQTEKNPVEIERIVSEELQPQPLAYAHDLETNVDNGESNPLVLLSQKLFGCRPEDLPPNLLPDLCQTLAMAPHLLRE